MKPPFTKSELFKARLEAIYKDQLPGGVGDSKTPEDFDEEVVKEGAEHELEHTYDPEIATEIAVDHLSEDEEYYSKLKKFGLAAYQEVQAAHAQFLVRALQRVVGNKVYMGDLEKLLDRLKLEPEELQTLSLLAKDLTGLVIDNKSWKGGF